MIRIALPLCLAAHTAQGATAYDCQISTLCDWGGDCFSMDAPLPMTMTVDDTGSGTVTIDGRSGTVDPAAEIGGAVGYLAREGDRSLALITVYPFGTVMVSVHDMTSPRDAVMMSGGCGES